MSEQGIIPVDQFLPDKIPLIPLMGKPIFPGIFTPLMISSDEDMEVVEEALSSHKVVGLVLVSRDDADDDLGKDDLYTVGTVAKITKKINIPDGGINIFISTIKRFRVVKYLTDQQPFYAAVEYIEEGQGDEDEDSNDIKALTRSLISEMKEISEDNPLFSEEMRLNMVNIDHPGKIADFITSILNIDRHDQQQILETFEVRPRMEQVLLHIKKEQELLKLQKQIQQQINEKVEKSQREYFLREELKAIKSELGMPVDSKDSEQQRFEEAIKKLPLEGEAKEQVEQELQKFSLMDPNSSEYQVTRNYLETIINLPWEDPEPEEVDIARGRQVLEEDHYGLADVKKRILEYLAVRKLKEDNRGSIVCLVGPPGVGKTSVGKSIARALKREFFRFSVGGMRDEAEIKGHRRTYVGAMPGKIIQGLKIVKTKAPVFMIDEIDKLGASFQGDPSSALLEVLDPEQNTAFRDHYLDLPFDLSSILFVVTANTLDTIPRPLLDRMEVIRLSGYIHSDKIEIAKRYLIPKTLKKHGLLKKHIRITKTALQRIAEGYARDAGMRDFEKSLDKIARKAAFQVVEGKSSGKELEIDRQGNQEEKEGTEDQELKLPISIKKETIPDYLGKEVFREDDTKKINRPGMAMGLAWTNFGGDTLVIEAVSNPGKETFRLTGQMGDVMKESANIAYTYIRHIAGKHGVKKEFFEKNQIHLHIPEGATPKDGPSAGITMAAALLSLAMGKTVRKGYAMTGELSLVGKVLPIGGLKEKVIAARRKKIKDIIIPAPNHRDLEEIPEHIRQGITFHEVKTVEEVIELLIPGAGKN